MIVTVNVIKIKQKTTHRLKPKLTGLVLSFCLSACAIPHGSVNTTSLTHAPVSVELKDVPFFAQTDQACGPAALAMVLNHQGQKTTPDELSPLVYVPERQGSLQVEMLAAPRRFGLLGYQLPPNSQALMSALNAGQPVLVLLNLSLQALPQWHYAVVVGFDAQRDEFILRSGTTPRETMSSYTFFKTWERSKNWGLLALNPETNIGKHLDPQAYLNALIGLERTNPKQALTGYQKATEAWPKEPWFHFGLGNVYMILNQPQEAEQELSQTVALYPDFSDAWNNLAEVQWKQGRKAEARAAINKALALGGANLKTYEDTAAKMN